MKKILKALLQAYLMYQVKARTAGVNKYFYRK